MYLRPLPSGFGASERDALQRPQRYKKIFLGQNREQIRSWSGVAPQNPLGKAGEAPPKS